MAEETIIQNLISQLGQSQDERLPKELGVHYADVDERTPEALVAYAQRLADVAVPFVVVETKPDPVVGPKPDPEPLPIPKGWVPLFKQPRLDGDTKAPLALFAAFLELYQFPRAAINRLTGRHLDFFYQRVLGFQPRSAVPDRAHIVVALKKGAPAVRVLPSHLFLAGKDASGAEVLYSPTSEFIVNTARVESLRSIFVDHTAQGRVLFAPFANSSDGLGGPLPEDSPKWRPFGHPDLPPADVGFAIAAPILRMKEGHRTITLSLTVDHLASLPATGVSDAFQAFLTGEKQWLGPFAANATVSAGRLDFLIDLLESIPAIADYNPKVHTHVYTTDAPVLQLFLKPGHSVGYEDVSRLRLDAARISVEVEGVTALTLESDAGTLDPKKAFLPFGPQAAAGSRLMIGCDEALAKNLSRLDLTLQWKGAPESFSTLYTDYSTRITSNTTRIRSNTTSITSNTLFTASAVFRDRALEHTRLAEPLFDNADAREKVVVHLTGTAAPAAPQSFEGQYVYALSRGGTSWSRRMARQMVLRRPVAGSFLSHAPEARRGFIVLTLNQGFLHAEYRKQSVAKILAKITTPDTDLLNEPYTPTLQSISLSYTAHTADVLVSSTSPDHFAQLDVQFFHVGPFGQMRDHGHQRKSLGFVSENVPLVPAYDQDGELLIGLSGLGAGDSASVLFQVAEGSANPDLLSQRPNWFVLCDNYWKPLGTAEVVRDTTNLLLTSGIVTFVIPKEATTDNTIMPAGLIWLKATVAGNPESTSQMVDVVANAVEVQFVMDSEDAAAAHLATAQPKGTIARLKTPIDFVNKLAQPYPSFGGRPREGEAHLRTRAAERLRHKNRGITAWDYERLVLGKFPSVHRVKCIPHANAKSWMAPGHVLVVVVPDLRNRNAPDLLQPKVDADTIVRIEEYLRRHVSGHAEVAVKNPSYQKVHVSFRVKFRTGYEFNFYKQQVQRALVEFLTPWAFDASRRATFGGRVYKSVLLDFVEELPSVDYVTDFKMFTFVAANDDGLDVDYAEPATPDAILVSDSTHAINEAG